MRLFKYEVTPSVPEKWPFIIREPFSQTDIFSLTTCSLWIAQGMYEKKQSLFWIL